MALWIQRESSRPRAMTKMRCSFTKCRWSIPHSPVCLSGALSPNLVAAAPGKVMFWKIIVEVDLWTRVLRARLHVQVRASPMAAAGGATHWSEPLALDGLGAAAVVTLPAPLQGLAGRVDAPHAAVILSVTARQVFHKHRCVTLLLDQWVFSRLLT